jgi:alpha-glucosidase (family GH31 glycosyl hydrolase)
MNISFVDKHILNIKIFDNDNQRFEIPQTDPFPHFKDGPECSLNESDFDVLFRNNPLSVTVFRKSTKEAIFDTKSFEFIFSDTYIQWGTTLPTPNIYGLGERTYGLNLGPTGTYTIWNKDSAARIENGTTGNNLYGSHPVYLVREKSNLFSMVYLRNSNAMDVVIENGANLTYKLTGGIIDLVIFGGGHSPETLVEEYHKYLGGWKLFPLWAHGYHQSRWGYQNVSMLEEVLGNFTIFNLPMDVIWSDIDYMMNYKDFSINQDNFSSIIMQSMLMNHSKRWVPIIDAGIPINYDSLGAMVGGYPLSQGLGNQVQIAKKRNVFLKLNEGSPELLGFVWPGPVYFPDFFNPNTTQWWIEILDGFYDLVNFSGIWLDMNEPSNFCFESCTIYAMTHSDRFKNLPYYPGGNYLAQMSLPPEASHHGSLLEFNVHNFYGFLQSKTTHENLIRKSNLTFILSRSTAPGSGRYAAHWTGDNFADWKFLRLSIPHMLSFNIFGIPMVGSDVCGFAGNTTEELCARWMQLGSVSPFFRNHNSFDTLSQEPYVFTDLPFKTMKASLDLRYAILKYYYMLFLNKTGAGTVIRPLFFEFPEDIKLFDMDHNIVDKQFMLGSSLLVVPVLQPNTSGVFAYFPKETWFDLYSGNVIQSDTQGSNFLYVDAPLGNPIPLFLRAGHLVFLQKTENVASSKDLDSSYKLVVGLKLHSNYLTWEANGKLLALSDFADENIVTKCQMASCLMNVTVTVQYFDYTADLKIIFVNDGNTNFEEIFIYEINLYGYPKRFEFEESVLNTVHNSTIHFERNKEFGYGVILLNQFSVKSESIVISITTPLHNDNDE